jgi:hypothetical protein
MTDNIKLQTDFYWIIDLLAWGLRTPICNNYKKCLCSEALHYEVLFGSGGSRLRKVATFVPLLFNHQQKEPWCPFHTRISDKERNPFLCRELTSSLHLFTKWLKFSIHLSNLFCQMHYISALLRAKRLVLFAYIPSCLLPRLWPWCLSSVLLDETLTWFLDLGTPTNSTSGLHFHSVSDQGQITLESCSGAVDEYFIHIVFLFYTTTPCRFHLLHICFVRKRYWVKGSEIIMTESCLLHKMGVSCFPPSFLKIGIKGAWISCTGWPNPSR